MSKFYYDLHMHSCLSPCGDNDNTPGNIVGMCALKELNVIALTDHNTCKNCPAVTKIAAEYGITVIPGMELTTSEEVHVVCLFYTLEDAMRFDAYVEEHQLPIPNDTLRFGDQIIMNEKDEQIGTVDHLLLAATDISFTECYDLVHSFNGIMIPAHIDKPSDSVTSQLGFVPEGSKFTCFEIANKDNLEKMYRINPYLKSCNAINDSDAHYLWLIHEAVNVIDAKENSVAAILQVLTGNEHKLYFNT